MTINLDIVLYTTKSPRVYTYIYICTSSNLVSRSPSIHPQFSTKTVESMLSYLTSIIIVLGILFTRVESRWSCRRRNCPYWKKGLCILVVFKGWCQNVKIPPLTPPFNRRTQYLYSEERKRMPVGATQPLGRCAGAECRSKQQKSYLDSHRKIVCNWFLVRRQQVHCQSQQLEIQAGREYDVSFDLHDAWK